MPAQRRRAAIDRMLTGAIMAGGRSRRMGRDKAALVFEGETLLRRQVRVLRDSGAARSILVVHRSGQELDEIAGTERVVDSVSDVGPLAGLHAALAASRTPLLAVLAVDMPFIDATWFRRLLHHCSDLRGAVAASSHGYEPLAAIYPAAGLDSAADQLRLAMHSLQDLVRRLVDEDRMVVIRPSEGERRSAVSWNRPADVMRGA